jgi:hypothetical protein
MILEARYFDKMRELRDFEVERQWCHRELVRLARQVGPSPPARVISALRLGRGAGATKSQAGPAGAKFAELKKSVNNM